jgi:threonine synthase
MRFYSNVFFFAYKVLKKILIFLSSGNLGIFVLESLPGNGTAKHFVAATNVNDTVPRFFKNGFQGN